MKVNRIKLMKQLLKFGNMVTDKGDLFYEGDLEEGLEVFVEGEGGEMESAKDGDYIVEDTIYVVKDGKIDSIKPVDPEAEVEPEAVEAEEVEPESAEITPETELEPEVAPDYEAVIKEKDDKIAELEAKVAELEAMVKEKEAKEVEMSAEILKLSNETVGKPAHVEAKEPKLTGNKFIDNYLTRN